ncbi:MAG: ABC transporter substrate-binding protein [Rhodospirillales bacterium]|jgi:peptide/nickel transport system substrate-binding protein|nr:peptide ABC transporter substrate-binding protein [Rhodospirillaceae bacterium]MAF47027.1 peptide ABC transporter substrate-binding protein [Rhodospirillaceae bacterium]MDP6426401.1 ABC transporter substrate-binding protein [Rhodospirillales bacterium]MDP6645748.1 ABC transporter substrate-binding protein [Rhodospirillales bacterium]MDP6840322.1 ABC transporter substrate-binding protein [Rhodospirillales bacterium]
MTDHKIFVLASLAASLLYGADAAAQVQPSNLIETPSLRKAVAAGKLPPVHQRLPQEPDVAVFDGKKLKNGRHGGSLTLLMGRKKDIRQMVVYGYARLVGYDTNFNLVPDILRKVEEKEGRIFTFHLRKGHRWSDGQPFTTEDFRYYFEESATNKAVKNMSLPVDMLVDGKLPIFEVIDKYTVRYTWHKPNPFFLPRLAGARPMYIYQPAHYMKNFNAKYTDMAKLKALVKKRKQRNWVALHYVLGQQYKNNNPKLPSLQPWILKTKPPSKKFRFARNPYFHRVDANGRQLPYIDEVKLNITSSKLIPIKSGSGETDLQSRGLNFNNYTVLKQSEKQFDYMTRLWRTAKGSRWALFPNLNVNNPVQRRLFRDARFRRALSMGIDRHEINQVIYYGLARETGNTVLPESPLYDAKFAKRWTEFNVERANRLLDELGLVKRTSQGTRLMADGKPLELTVVFSTEESEPPDLLELIRDSWRRIGIKVFSKPLNREVMRTRIFSGFVQMALWFGLENGVPSDSFTPKELAPTSQQQLQWPKWGQWHETRGKAGEPIDMKLPKELFRLNDDWRNARSPEERKRIWRRMLDIYSDQAYSIGLIASVPQVIVVRKSLRNVPEKAIYNWDPGAHFGVYRPDTFWIEPKKNQS